MTVHVHVWYNLQLPARPTAAPPPYNCHPLLQVLCSRGLWDDSGLETQPDLDPAALAVGESCGEVALKGLAAKMEVINCM